MRRSSAQTVLRGDGPTVAPQRSASASARAGRGPSHSPRSDTGAGRPEVQNPGADETGGRGLLVVETLAHRWGVQDRTYGIGKTVWAELKAPDIVAAPAEKRVAAVTVQVGRRVKRNGQWHTVRTVRCERSPSGGTVTLLGLDDAPMLRLDAAEPLTVRDRGRHD